jgi:predicted ATPase/transcriptional regulator with XRE-family HTH domain
LGEKDATALTTFGALLRRHRLAAGLTQESLAEGASLGIRSIQDLESGLHRPRHETVQQLVRALRLAGDQRTHFEAAGQLEAAGQPAPRQRTEVASASATIPAPPGRPRRTNLPPRLTSFVGREGEIADVQGLLRAKRLVTLTGPGGVGKTSLALEVAAAMREQFADGIWLVELAALTDPQLVAHAVAATLGVREQPGEPILATLGTALGTTERLLVVDNCEHLLDGCARLAEALLRACPRLRILVTSREPLRVGAEVIWRVPSLTLPDHDDQAPGELAKSEAVRLFVERAEAVQPSFALTAGNAAAVAQICRRLDGIPLAIELAAARVSALTPEQIAQHLSDRFRLLRSGSRTALPRHQTLRALIDWSYDLLSEKEQVLFRRLAVFVGSSTLEAAEAVCRDVGAETPLLGAGGGTSPDTQNLTRCTSGDVLDLLVGLVDKSLVLVEERDGEARYRLLETLREYAQERLAESGQADDLREAHAVFFLALAEQRAATDWNGHDVRYLDQLEVEHENLRAALQWFADRGDAERGLRLSSALGIFWFIRGYFTEGQRWLDYHLGRSDRVSTVIRATALEVAGRLAFGRADLEVAATYARESVATWRRLGDRRRFADVLHLLGQIARNQCSYPDALAALEESLQINQEYDDQFFIAEDLFQLGLIARQRSELARARSLLNRALTIQSALGHPRPVGITLFHLGLVAEEQGDYSREQSLYEQSVGFLQQVKDRRELAFLLDGFASLSVARSQYRRGAVLSGAATALRQQIGSAVPPPMQPRVDRTLRLARDGLGEAAFAQALAEGQAMTLEEAIAYALESKDEDG